MLDDEDLGPADEALLDLLQEGRVTAPFAAEEADYSLQYVRDRLGRLVEHGNARKVYEGLYELVEDPREDTTGAEAEAEAPEPERAAEAGVDTDRALYGWSHGRSEREQEASEAVAVAALEWLADYPGAAKKSDVPLDELAASDDLDRSANTLWTEVIRPAWQHAEERGFIEQPKTRSYEWVGGDE